MKLKIAILFGGKSAEHEISLQSAQYIYATIDKEKFDPILIGIDKRGRWYKSDEEFSSHQGVSPLIGCYEYLKEIDVAFPVIHGPYGEDGKFQGLFEVLDIPYVGANVLGSSIAMDKDVMKRLLRESSIPTPKFLVFEETPNFEQVEKALGLPFFVKPVNLGSSIGINKVSTRSDFLSAIEEAFLYDTKIIIEEAIEGREIECSILGWQNPIASLPAEVRVKKSFYSYEAKYDAEAGTEFDFPANLSKEKEIEVKRLALETFRVLCCEGMARVDFFMRPNGELLVNELNTIPGFTKMSVYPKLWAISGVEGKELITHLIEIAIARREEKKFLLTDYLASSMSPST